MFEEGGYGQRGDDPAALAVKGRLLKQRALSGPGGNAGDPALLRAAIEAYAQAHALTPAPYLLINVATLTALAGDPVRAATLAREVLAMLDRDPAETPYYIAATRAEAMLLIGDLAGAAAALKAAAAADADGWDNRAGTVQQLARICETQGRDAGWLDRFRPPASAHYIGHMGFASGGMSERVLADDLDATIARERIGFAFGALAAGADIIIAERVLAAGGEVHLVLPMPVEAFAAISLPRGDTAWRNRFDAVLARATSLTTLGEGDISAHDPLATALAGTIAMGRARLHGEMLASRALQYAVTDNTGGGENTRWQIARWAVDGAAQHVLATERDDLRSLAKAPANPQGNCMLLALMTVRIGQDDGTRGRNANAIAQALANLRPTVAIPEPEGWMIGCAAPADALSALVALSALPKLGVTGHYGIVELIEDPLTSLLLPCGHTVVTCRTLAQQTVPGAAVVSEHFAAALMLEPHRPFDISPLGDAGTDQITRYAISMH